MFLLLTIMNNAAMNISNLFKKHTFFIFLKTYLQVEFWDHVVTLCLTFWRIETVSKMLCHFTFPPSMYESFNFSISSLTHVIVCLFDDSHSSGCKLISYCGFDFLILIGSVSVVFVFLGICLFHLRYLIWWHTIIHNFPL